MYTCGICQKPADQLFETSQEGVHACFKCQPLVPEVTIDDEATSDNSQSQEYADSPYSCGICHKTFQKNQQLQNHVRNHRAERRFVCTYCSKAFSQSNNLRAHLRIHTNERPFKCNECGKAFTQVTNLNNHVRLHTGERPFVCSEPGCDKAFAQVTNLNQHRKRHFSGRPIENSYDCNVCGEQFQQRNHMTNHRRAVHSEVKSPVRAIRRSCAICDLSFPSERLLQLHAAQHAPSEIEIVDTEIVTETENDYACVFSTCGMRFSSPSEHTEHLLRAHQLRVLATPGKGTPPKRGRPPKVMQNEVCVVDTEDSSHMSAGSPSDAGNRSSPIALSSEGEGDEEGEEDRLEEVEEVEEQAILGY